MNSSSRRDVNEDAAQAATPASSGTPNIIEFRRGAEPSDFMAVIDLGRGPKAGQTLLALRSARTPATRKHTRLQSQSNICLASTMGRTFAQTRTSIACWFVMQTSCTWRMFNTIKAQSSWPSQVAGCRQKGLVESSTKPKSFEGVENHNTGSMSQGAPACFVEGSCNQTRSQGPASVED